MRLPGGGRAKGRCGGAASGGPGTRRRYRRGPWRGWEVPGHPPRYLAAAPGEAAKETASEGPRWRAMVSMGNCGPEDPFRGGRRGFDQKMPGGKCRPVRNPPPPFVALKLPSLPWLSYSWLSSWQLFPLLWLLRGPCELSLRTSPPLSNTPVAPSLDLRISGLMENSIQACRAKTIPSHRLWILREPTPSPRGGSGLPEHMMRKRGRARDSPGLTSRGQALPTRTPRPAVGRWSALSPQISRGSSAGT